MLTAKDNPGRLLLAQYAEVAKTLSCSHRLELLDHLAQGEWSVETLAGKAGLSIANTSQHLLQLKRRGFIESRKEGRYVLYRIGGSKVSALLKSLREFAEENDEHVREIIDDYFHRVDRLEPVGMAELLAKLQHESVTLLDVRPQDEYDAGHLPGALNIPLDELTEQLAQLPADRDIIVYCRGPYCALSFEAIDFLRKRGYSIRRFDGGFPEWKSEGLQIEIR